MKRILILYTSIGLGHKAIAQAFEYHLQKSGYAVVSKDILQVEGGWLSRAGTVVYLKMVAVAPWIWDWLYESTFILRIFNPVREFLAARNAEHTLRLIQKVQPDLVISTQITASSIVSHLKNKGHYTGLFGVGFSDYHFHPAWVVGGVDAYFANIPSQKHALESMGIVADRIFITGIPLRGRVECEKAEVRASFGISGDRKVLLVAAGSLGISLPLTIIEQLATVLDSHVIVVCGKNEKLRSALQERFVGVTNVTILGFVTEMNKIYAISDAFISKPGGISVAEALSWRLPMFITHVLPGQEARNMDYLNKEHLVLDYRGKTVSDIVSGVRYEVETGEFRESLERNTKVSEILAENVAEAPIVVAVKGILEQR